MNLRFFVLWRTEIAAKAPKDAQPFFQSAQAIAAPYIKAGKWHTFSGSEAIVDGVQLVSLHGHTPGHTGYEFSSKGQKILFWGDIIHAQVVQLKHLEITAVFDIDQAAAAATRNQLLPTLAREDVVIAGPHMPFPALRPPAQGGERLYVGASGIQRSTMGREIGDNDDFKTRILGERLRNGRRCGGHSADPRR